MSLLGATFDAFLSSTGGIIDFCINIILGIKDLIILLLSMIPDFVSVLSYAFNIIEFFISIMLNPSLLLLFILGSAFWYASFAAETRKDLIKQTGIYWVNVAQMTSKLMNAIFTIVHKIVVGIMDMI